MGNFPLQVNYGVNYGVWGVNYGVWGKLCPPLQLTGCGQPDPRVAGIGRLRAAVTGVQVGQAPKILDPGGPGRTDARRSGGAAPPGALRLVHLPAGVSGLLGF